MTTFKLSADRDLPKRCILSISSDFGVALAESWLDRKIEVAGTYRTDSVACVRLRDKGAKLIQCDLSDAASLTRAIKDLKGQGEWDVLVVAEFGNLIRSMFANFEFNIQFLVHGKSNRVANERVLHFRLQGVPTLQREFLGALSNLTILSWAGNIMIHCL